MYESITYELILQRMLDKVPDTIDKREGSVIYDALAPAAVELQKMYIELDVVLNESFADTESRSYLIKRAAERGIAPTDATYAILKGAFNIDIEIGARFSLGTLNYIASEKINTGVYKLKCETAGAIGNTQFGKLIPIDYINGLSTAQLTELLIPGENAEDTEVFRKRYLNSFRNIAFGGNRADYIEKVNAIDGVGGTKVYRAWKGGGTVKLVIINSEYQVPSAEMIATVQTLIDPTVNAGDGLGIAPIDHVATVFPVTSQTIDIVAAFTYQSGWSFDECKVNLQAVIDGYFKELAKGWEDTDNLIIRISQLETRILDVAGIVDIEGTTINGVASNFTVNADAIPVRGNLNARS